MQKIKLINVLDKLNLCKNEIFNSFLLEKKRLIIHHEGSIVNESTMKQEITNIMDSLVPYTNYLKIKQNKNSVEILM